MNAPQNSLDPYTRGRETAQLDALYTTGQAVSRSTNPYDDLEKAAEWNRGYQRLPRLKPQESE